MGRTIVSGIANGGIYGLLAVGLVLIYRGSRVLNFAQGELGTFGLFVASFAVKELHLPWIAAAAVALVVVGAIGYTFDALVVRRMADASRLSVAVATIGLLFLLLSVELKVFGVSPRILPVPVRGLGPRLFGFYVSPTYLLSLLVALALGFALTAFLRRTDFGLGVLAAAQDPTAVRLVGVPLRRVGSFTWVSASMIAVIAALLIEPNIGSFVPGFMTLLFIYGLAAALIGGLRSLPGAFIGGIAVGLTQAIVGEIFSGSSFPHPELLALFMIVIAVLVFRPQGLLGGSD
ncbi:MAG: branched-chain amino acid ABC transporter permease [Actinomycetota bacterium]|nr:branched-chain amino acid ABC transporter permease [Actinomycetota bacterium]